MKQTRSGGGKRDRDSLLASTLILERGPEASRLCQFVSSVGCTKRDEV